MNRSKPSAAVLLFAVMTAVAAAQGEARVSVAGRPQQDPMAATEPTTLSAAWRTALSTMRAHKAPGLVFVLPDAAAKADADLAAATLARFRTKLAGGAPLELATQRDLLLAQIQLLRQGTEVARAGAEQAPFDLTLAFGLAVPVVADAATCGALPGETIVVFGEDGTRKAGLKVDVGDADAVATALQPHLFAGERLAARRATVPPQLQAKVEEFVGLWRRLKASTDGTGEPVDGAAAERHAALYQELRGQLFAAAPGLVGAQPTAAAAVGTEVLRSLLEWTTPLGTAVAQTWDPCPPCGMMAMPMPFRSALKLLAQ